VTAESVPTLRLELDPWPQPLRWTVVCERFELPATFCGALRYEDPDGDLISVSTDDEVQEALRLCGDGKTLKMTLRAARDSPAAAAPQDEAPVGKAWAGALSNVFEDKEAVAPVAALDSPSSPASVSSASVSSASGDGFEMVESDSRPASVRSSTAAPESAEVEDEALQAALKASAAEEAARVAAEAARKAAEEVARKAAEEEVARKAAEEEVARKAAEEVAARKAAEEVAARKAAEEEVARKAAEEEAACKAAEEEAARKAAEEAAASRSAAQELAARIAAEEEAALKAAEEEAEKAEATAAEEKRARLEIAFAAAEEDALRRADELFNMGCSVDQIRSLYGESILMQLRLVPRMSDVHNQAPVVPEPVVNWEAAKAVSEQPEDERFPSDEQAAVVDEVGELAARLTAFYFEHCPSMIDNVGEVSRKFAGRQQELNDALLRKYKCDLNSFADNHAKALAAQEEQDAAAARQLAAEDAEEERLREEVRNRERLREEVHNAVAVEELHQEEPPASTQRPVVLRRSLPMSDELREAIASLEAMGFTDRTSNLALLQKHSNNVEAALNELLG